VVGSSAYGTVTVQDSGSWIKAGGGTTVVGGALGTGGELLVQNAAQMTTGSMVVGQNNHYGAAIVSTGADLTITNSLLIETGEFKTLSGAQVNQVGIQPNSRWDSFPVLRQLWKSMAPVRAWTIPQALCWSARLAMAF